MRESKERSREQHVLADNVQVSVLLYSKNALRTYGARTVVDNKQFLLDTLLCMNCDSVSLESILILALPFRYRTNLDSAKVSCASFRAYEVEVTPPLPIEWLPLPLLCIIQRLPWFRREAIGSWLAFAVAELHTV